VCGDPGAIGQVVLEIKKQKKGKGKQCGDHGAMGKLSLEFQNEN
jgi:hypothetical protein